LRRNFRDGRIELFALPKGTGTERMTKRTKDFLVDGIAYTKEEAQRIQKEMNSKR